MPTLAISARIVGRRTPALQPVRIPVDRPFRTARELIEALVRQQVSAFRDRHQDARMLRVLTDREIEEGAETGRLVSGGVEFAPQPVDLESAIRSAITAFDDGFYFLFVNDVQVETLDTPLPAGDLDALFVRLTPLAGG
ncbi:MAG: hypothetical protein R2729_29155 [Bryobacteraceae bacterium]